MRLSSQLPPRFLAMTFISLPAGQTASSPTRNLRTAGTVLASLPSSNECDETFLAPVFAALRRSRASTRETP